MEKTNNYKWKLIEVIPDISYEEMSDIINRKLASIIIKLEDYYKKNINSNKNNCENS